MATAAVSSKGGSGLGVESLALKCIRVIAENFKDLAEARKGAPDQLPDKSRALLTEMLPLDLDIGTAATHVHADSYWKRRCQSRKGWKNFELRHHGFSWKQLFYEKNLEELLENFKSNAREDKLRQQIKASRDYVYSLNIQQLLSHINLEILFTELPNFSHLELTYGAKKLRLNYDRSLFGMKFSDAESLSMCLENTATLVSLSLRCNILDDDLLEILMEGLSQNFSLTHLDLSHNKLSDVGAQMLSEYLSQPCTLMYLNLADNQIYGEGGLLLGRALHYNSTLCELNMRLNRLGDMGGRVLLDGLVQNTTLTSVNLSSNSLADEATTMLSALLSNAASPLTLVDLSSNDLTETEGRALLKALRGNERLINLDLRLNKIEADAPCLREIQSIMTKNELRLKKRSLK